MDSRCLGGSGKWEGGMGKEEGNHLITSFVFSSKPCYWNRDHFTNTDLQGMNDQGQASTCLKAFHRFLNV